jgi:hypothetical protein
LVFPPPSVRRTTARDLRSSRRWCETCPPVSAVRWSDRRAVGSACFREGPSSGSGPGANTFAVLPVPRSSPGPGRRGYAFRIAAKRPAPSTRSGGS